MDTSTELVTNEMPEGAPDGSVETEVAEGTRVLPPPPPDLSIVDDAGLAAALNAIASRQHQALVITNAYTACLFQRTVPYEQWSRVCCGELGDQSLDAAKPLSRNALWWGTVSGAPWEADPEAVVTAKGTVTLLKRWSTEAEKVAGREGDATQAVKDELTYLAAWRCQFAGCGRDLKRHGATGGRGRFSYFAHIVAASPEGPRGDPLLSKLLASELSNFMLLCDECHRLIDKINPAKYTVEVLRKMREENLAEVARLLGNLQHKPAEVLAFLGNVSGQPAPFTIDDAQEALWCAGLRTTEVKPTRYFSPGGHNHNVHSIAYWASLFEQLKLDLPTLQGLLNGSRTGTARPRLAIFPLHGTSVLLLTGRVLGDHAATQLFQPHRNKVNPSTRWAWPVAGSLPAPPLEKFKLETLVQHQPGIAEATLVVALTSDVDASRMPETCATNSSLSLPTLRIKGTVFNKDCIEQPEDLQVLGLVVDEAIRRLQDEWRVNTVHLFVSAPASAAVVVGQKMQARHHADFICYEAEGGPGSAYRPTIKISSASVQELISSPAHSLQLSLQ